jgi:demethylmenaquinone methyltransferase/2-methoxy-6-polyprenyl-1,4-benzoquinol methylase
MFNAVAPRYDFLNRLLSLGFDVRWRRRAIGALGLEPGARLLDLCAGTGDLGLEAARRVPDLRVVGVDLAGEMLRRGRRKLGRVRYHLVQGDVEWIPLRDGSVDGACVGFGIRNVASLRRVMAETARVLRPGGRFAILEFTTPPLPLWQRFYHAYFHHVLPRIGGWISGQPDAYRYLPESVGRFSSPDELGALLGASGFSDVRWSLLQGGIAALHLCRR